MHIPVLLKEVLKYLDPKLGQNFIDTTVGNGGHARAILEKTAPTGKLIAIDRDHDSLERARANLSDFGRRALFINDSFGNLKSIVDTSGIRPINGIIFDFGMSSSQLENSGRGFSFKKDEILDMRFSHHIQITAEDVVNEYSEEQLATIFKKWGEEPEAARIAQAIILARRMNRIKTTGDLAVVVEKSKRWRGKIHPATKVFQALRIEVNQELAEIEKALVFLPGILSKNGRVAFISFHSLEDRIIKNWSRDLNKKNIIKILNKKPIIASTNELKANPRSRSAKLRVIEKI